MAEYSLIPVDVPFVSTRYRKIKTPIPVPESVPVFEQLLLSEPRSMSGQPPVIWHRAEDFTVSDPWGNQWIDWSSCVLVANSGHGRKEIRKALKKSIDQGLLATYVFAHEKRAELVKMIQDLSPDPSSYRVFLLSTGSEAIENCIKLTRTYAMEKAGPDKNIIVGYDNAFHGRTMGAQLAGGITGQRKWIGEDKTFVHMPFPDGYKNEDISFGLFIESLRSRKVAFRNIAGVITESYQGVGPDFFPAQYARELEAFCREHDILLTMDEVQSGFGRTGKMFCYEHYGIKPDLIACGKGISSSLPLSAVIGRKDIMDLYPPGSMTSTHSASPLPVAAAVANIRIIQKEKLVERAASTGLILQSGLGEIQKNHQDRLGCLHGMGMVAGIQAVRSGSKIPDPETALRINTACFQKGLLMFAPVGVAGECIKISPPLTITRDALLESLSVFEETVREVLKS